VKGLFTFAFFLQKALLKDSTDRPSPKCADVSTFSQIGTSSANDTPIFFVPHLSAFFDTLRVLLVKLKAFLWAPKKDFTPLCSKGVKFFFATATFFFATANFFLPTVVSTSSKKKVAVPQAVLIVPTLQWSRCFASKKYVVSSYMKLTLIHGIWNRNEDFIIFC